MKRGKPKFVKKRLDLAQHEMRLKGLYPVRRHFDLWVWMVFAMMAYLFYYFLLKS